MNGGGGGGGGVTKSQFQAQFWAYSTILSQCYSIHRSKHGFHTGIYRGSTVTQ